MTGISDGPAVVTEVCAAALLPRLALCQMGSNVPGSPVLEQSFCSAQNTVAALECENVHKQHCSQYEEALYSTVEYGPSQVIH